MSSPSDPNANLWREALDFVRSQTELEIGNIERLYARALKVFTAILASAAIVAAFLGITTYATLKDLVVTTTKSEMDRVVKQQIADQLKREGVEQIVQDTVKGRAEVQLRSVISQEVSAEVSQIVERLEPEIKEVANREARRIVAEQLAPRSLSSTQRAVILNSLSSAPHSYQYSITTMDGSPEENEFRDQIVDVLKKARWEAIVGSPFGFGGPETFQVPGGGEPHGLFLVVTNPDHMPMGASELLRAFEKAGVGIAVAKSTAPTEMAPQTEEMIRISVGPK